MVESDKFCVSSDDEKNKISKDIEQVERDIYEGGKSIDQAGRDLEARKKLVALRKRIVRAECHNGQLYNTTSTRREYCGLNHSGSLAVVTHGRASSATFARHP